MTLSLRFGWCLLPLLMTCTGGCGAGVITAPHPLDPPAGEPVNPAPGADAAACDDGAVAAAGCACGGVVKNVGYCCANAWQAGECACAAPTFSLAAGTYVGSQSVTVSSATSGTTIYCGASTPPTVVCASPVVLAASTTLYAVAKKTGYADSAVSAALYVIAAAPPSSCGSGAIAASCTCGGATHADGFCCTGAWQAGACAAPPSCATEPVRGTGTVYYVCDCQAGAQAGCVAGNDAALGTSPDQPWQSWGKARSRFESMAAGSSVAFCDGGSWTGAGTAPNTYYRNTQCSAASTCDWRNYPTAWGNGVRPKIQLAPGYEFLAMGWYENYANVIHGFRFFNLDIRGQSADGLATHENGIQLWGGVTDVDLCNLEVHHGVATAVGIITSSTTARITLRDSYVHDNRGTTICVVCGGADDFLVSHNVFDRNGAANMFSHAIYFSQAFDEPQCGNGETAVGHYCPNRRLRVTDNVITRTAWGSGATCLGVALVAHDVFDDVLIANNLISEPEGAPGAGCYGIGWSNGGEAAQFSNLVIRGNRLFNMGGIGIAVMGAANVLIENNVIASPSFTYSWTGIAYPQAPYAPGVDRQSNNGTVRNNTIYLPDGGDGEFAISGVDEGTGHVYANNAIVTGPGTGFCVKAPSGATVVANACSTTGTGWWQAASVDAATANFRPAVGSPLFGVGSATYAPSTDILGSARGSPPTVGAYEQ